MLFKTLVGAAVAAGICGAAHAQPVGIATSNPGSLLHNIGSAVAKVASESGLDATIQPATSPGQYLPLVAANEIEFGVSNLPEFNLAVEGKAWFSDRGANPSLRLVGLIFPLRVAIFVRQDSGIQEIADLRGKPMVDGFTAQQTILPQLDAMYATAGMTRDDVVPVQVTSVVAGADAFIQGDSVGFYFAHGAGKVREADAAVGIRALPIESTETNLAAIREHWPTAYLIEIAPGPAVPGVQEPGHFMAFPQGVFTNADVPDDVVYAMAKAIYENKEGLAEVFPPFNIFNPDEMVREDVGPAEYHPGAIRFYKEIGIWKG